MGFEPSWHHFWTFNMLNFLWLISPFWVILMIIFNFLMEMPIENWPLVLENVIKNILEDRLFYRRKTLGYKRVWSSLFLVFWVIYEGILWKKWWFQLFEENTNRKAAKGIPMKKHKKADILLHFSSSENPSYSMGKKHK